MEPQQKQQILADLALLLVTLIWGSTFVAVQDAVARYPVFAFLTIRFGIAALVMLVLFGRRLKNLGWWGIKAGALIGVFLFAGYALQTLGLQQTTATKAGLITGLQTVAVPIITAIWLRRAPERRVLLAAVLAAIGLALISLKGTLAPEAGDLYVLGCAISFGAHITAVGILAPRTDPFALTTVQIAFVALASTLASLVAGGIPAAIPGSVLGAAAFTGIMATAVAFAIQNAVSQYTTPEHTGLVFAMEPVFAALFGYLLAGERLGPRALFGGCLILLAMLMTELRNAGLWAKYISYALNPLFLSGPVIVLAGVRDAATIWQGIGWTLFALVVGVCFPLVFLFVQLRRGGISDWHVSAREERVRRPLVLMALFAASVPLIALWALHGPLPLQAMFATGLLLVVATLIITAFWKVSQHVIGIATVATSLTILAGSGAAAAFLLVPVVAWARVVVGAHTRAQTIVGGFIGCACPLVVFRAFGLV